MANTKKSKNSKKDPAPSDDRSHSSHGTISEKDDLSSDIELVQPKNSSTSSATPSKGQKYFQMKYGADKDIKLTTFCPSIKSVADGALLDVEALVEDLKAYAEIHYKWNTVTNPLHPFSSLFQALWEHISSSTVRDMVKNLIIDCYFNLGTDTRIMFRPVYDKVQEFSQFSSTADVLNRRRLIAIDSKEISMSGTKLSGNTTPTELDTFVDAMERCLESRHNWKRLLQVRVPVDGVSSSKKSQKFVSKNILTDHKTIPIKALVKLDFHRSESLQDASLSLYEDLSNTMTASFRSEMRLYRDKINNQGPKLLYFILQKLTQRDSRIVADLQLEIPTFESTFKDTGYDMHLVCPILFNRLLQYKCAGGNPETHYSILCSAFISMHCDSLTSAVREWEQSQMRKFNKKSIFD